MASTAICKVRNFHILKSFKWTLGARPLSSTHLRLDFPTRKCRKLFSNHKILPTLGQSCKQKNLSQGPIGAQSFFVNKVKADYDQNEGFKVDGREVAPGLSATVTPELEEEILEGKPALKFKQVLHEIVRLERKVYPLPLPAELTLDQWRTLLSLEDSVARTYYLDSLVWGERTLEEVREVDRINSSPLSEQVTEEMLEEAFGTTEDSLESRKRLNTFLMVHEIERQRGELVARTIDVKHMIEIAKLDNKSQFLKYMSFMLKGEMRDLSFFTKKRCARYNEKSLKKKNWDAKKNEKHIFYGLGENTIQLRLSNQTIDNFNNWRAVREFHEWGQPLVIDFSFLNLYKQKPHFVNSFFKQELTVSISNNRAAESPFQLHLTSVNAADRKVIEKGYPNASNPECCFNITDRDVTDLYDQDRLVYLSPDSRNDLKEIDPDDVYVIGGIVDKHDRQPLTLSRAKRQGIRHARFPMKRILDIKADLNVETCVGILCDMKAYQDWFYAFRWVPSRYLGNRCKMAMEDTQIEHQLIYRAHRALSPTTGSAEDMVLKRRLKPKQYREMYVRITKAQSREEMEQILEELKLLV